MGTIKTTNIETITGSGTLTLGQSGETISVPSGATINLSNATQTGVGGVNTPAFRVYRNSSVTLSSGTNTIVTFDQENFDTGSMYDTSNGKFTPTESGKYYIFAMVSWDLGGGINYIELRKNGSNISSNYTNISSLASGRYVFHIHNIVEADGDDYFEINVYQGSGSNKTLHSGTANTFFGGYKIIE